jgi:hypothetical protein
MDSIVAGTKLKKVDKSTPLKPRDVQGGMGGALARAMDQRSRAMHSSGKEFMGSFMEMFFIYFLLQNLTGRQLATLETSKGLGPSL